MTDNRPFFSVVLPIYNVERYLDRCINSILSQDFQDYEIILVDDGSKDRCPQMCDEWQGKDSRIKVIHKENAGLGMARNTGLEMAEGKYIYFIDSDDYILPGLFSDVYSRLMKKEHDVVFYGVRRVDFKGNELRLLVPDIEKVEYDSNDEIKNELFPEFITKNPHTGHITNLVISMWNSCWRVDFFKENGLKFVSEREYISEDIWFYVDAFRYLQSVEIISKLYYCYCQNEGSLTVSYKPERFSRIKKFYSEVIDFARQAGYSDEVILRLHSSFLGTTLGCLKTEASQFNKAGFFKAYKRCREICKDEMLRKAVRIYPKKHLNKHWKMFCFCVNHKLNFILYLKLILQYYVRGI